MPLLQAAGSEAQLDQQNINQGFDFDSAYRNLNQVNNETPRQMDVSSNATRTTYGYAAQTLPLVTTVSPGPHFVKALLQVGMLIWLLYLHRILTAKVTPAHRTAVVVMT